MMKKQFTMLLTAVMVAALPVVASASPFVYVGKGQVPDQIKDFIQSNNMDSISNWDEICEKLQLQGNCPEFNLPECDLNNSDLPDFNCPDINWPSQKPDQGDQNKPDQGDQNKPSDDNNQSGSESAYEAEVLKLVNEERVKAGLSSVSTNSAIQKAAGIRAEEQQKSFSHTRPNGTQFSTVLTENGVSFRGSGENIAWGQKTPKQVMDAWMNSEGHRANILNPKFTTIGVGNAQINGTNYWTQLFTY